MTRQRPLGLGTHIFVSDADAAVAFYSEAFGAAELIRHCLPDGRVLFVELAVGPDKLLLSEEIKELNAHPQGAARPRRGCRPGAPRADRWYVGRVSPADLDNFLHHRKSILRSDIQEVHRRAISTAYGSDRPTDPTRSCTGFEVWLTSATTDHKGDRCVTTACSGHRPDHR